MPQLLRQQHGTGTAPQRGHQDQRACSTPCPIHHLSSHYHSTPPETAELGKPKGTASDAARAGRHLGSALGSITPGQRDAQQGLGEAGPGAVTQLCRCQLRGSEHYQEVFVLAVPPGEVVTTEIHTAHASAAHESEV